MNGPLEWIASIGTMLAAAMIAFDLGRRATGWGFVLFAVVSVLWIVSGLTTNSKPIIAMNAVLLLINLWGVWQYLIHPKNTAELEQLKHRTEREQETERSGGDR